MKNQSLEIIVCGDLCPTPDTKEYFESQDKDTLFNDVISVFKKSDFVLGNLEFVLTDTPSPIKKAGPILHANTNYLKVLKEAGIQTVSLANNHIKDCGEKGVLSTISTCKENKIDFFGAGKKLSEAKDPYIKIIDEYKIGFISFAEQEFNVASDTECGAAFLDPYEDFDRISEFRQQVDYLIILYHGGIEYYEYPSPLLQKKCRKFIEKGADLVTCQHSHCIGTIEDYNQGTILYGQGNTLFGYREGDDSWNQGLLIKLTFEDKKTKPELEFIPIHATKKGIEKLDKSNSKELLESLHNKSLKIKDPNFIKSNWVKFCTSKQSDYMAFLFGFNRILVHLNRLLKNRVVKIFFSKKSIMINKNIIRCESHNEVLSSILNELG